MDYIKDLISQNQFLEGGLVLGIITSTLYAFKVWGIRFITYLWERHVMYSIKIESHSNAYTKVSEYLIANYPDVVRSTYMGPSHSAHEVMIGDGTFLLYFDRLPIWVSIREKDAKAGSYDVHNVYHMMTLRTILSRKRFDNFMSKVNKYHDSIKKKEKFIQVRVGVDGDYTRIKNYKTLDHLCGSWVQDVKSKVDGYVSNREKRKAIGKRDKFVLHLGGPPGSGKTSCAIALAEYLGKQLIVPSASSLKSGEQLLSTLTASAGGILLLEDFDRLSFHYKNDTDNMLQIILQMLDGTLTPDDCFIIITTNDASRLDRALVREGRIDFDVHCPVPTIEDIKALHNRRFPGVVLPDTITSVHQYDNWLIEHLQM